MVLKDGEDTSFRYPFTGGFRFFRGAVEGPDFQFEISKGNFTKLMTRKGSRMLLMATKKLKMVKTREEINKIAGC